MKAATFLFSCALLLPLPAVAATVTYSGGPVEVLPGLQLFDAALGTLNSVTVEFSGTQVVRMNTGLGGPQNVNYDARGFYSVYVGPYFYDFESPPNPSYPGNSSSKGSGATVINANGLAEFTLSGAITRTLTSAAELTFYTGVGTTFMSAQTDPIVVTLSNGFSGGGLSQTRLSRLTSYSVTYDYTPVAAAVPEPVSWALMLSGFGLAGWRLRRRGGRLVAVRPSQRAGLMK